MTTISNPRDTTLRKLRIGDIPIGFRLGAGFGMLIMLAAFMGLVGLYFMGEINDRVENMYTQELVTIEALDDAKSALYRIRGDSLEHILSETKGGMHKLAGEINDQQRRVDERLKQYRATRLAPEERSLVDTFEKHYLAYLNRVENEILPLSAVGNKEEAEALARGAAVEEFRKARVAMNELMDYSLTRAAIRYQNSIMDFKTAFWTVVTIVVTITLLGGLVSLWLTRAIVRPLQRVIGYFGEIARGNLDNVIDVRSRDEIGQVLLALIDTQAKLAKSLSERKRAETALLQAHSELETKVLERTRELAEANERLKEIDRLKSEFVATMSHELRTPLNSIIGFTGIVLQGIPGPINAEQEKQLSMAYGSAKHLLSLINDILDLSRIESGKMEIRLEAVELHQIVSDAMRSLAPMAERKKLSLHMNVPEHLPAARGDRKKILQVLLNLIHNAIKFTDQGKVEVVCALRGANLEVSIADTGCGIREKDKPLLFSAFRQIDGIGTEHRGTGLGLYLSEKLIALLGSHIRVESEFGKGSRFWFTLPMFEREPTAP